MFAMRLPDQAEVVPKAFGIPWRRDPSGGGAGHPHRPGRPVRLNDLGQQHGGDRDGLGPRFCAYAADNERGGR